MSRTGAAAVSEMGYTDDTGPRVRAYLDGVRLLRGCVLDGEDLTNYQRGALLIERIAQSARGEGRPRVRLTAAQCADVLRFMSLVEPRRPARWHIEPEDAPSHLVGQMVVLQVLSDSLRAPRGVTS